VTIILGGDFLFDKTKTPTPIPATRKGRRDIELSRGYDRLYLAQWWYNLNYHSYIKMSSFQALYGYFPPNKELVT